jgi:Zn-dependent protease
VFDTYTLGRVLGIPVRVHGLLLVLLMGLLLMGAARGEPVVLPVAAVIIALLAHELGHALMARRLGVQVVDVVLGPIVSKAHLAGLPEHAGTEARIAVAGPLANLVLASLGWTLSTAWAGSPELTLQPTARAGTPMALLHIFVLVNLLLGVGNLLPAFPMDGGRLLRAGLVASGKGWLAATELAVKIGKYLAFALLVLGFVRSFVFVLIALFVLFAGARELLAVRLRHGAPLFGGGARGGRFAGTFDLGALLRGRAAAGAAKPPAPDASQGPAPTEPPPPTGSGSGFSDADVEKLESYRGRLRRGLDEL